jgi:hypothetical protein
MAFSFLDGGCGGCVGRGCQCGRGAGRAGRRRSEPAGDGDDGVEGEPTRAWAAALGAEVAVGGGVEQKMNRVEVNCAARGRKK